ncbi:hypothetical protein HanOQP8_Chr16g0627361 [Helianthus annuus]|nr:hypothetical protein HanIR_Chr16g0827841 [Helianthus annuus]KAJ0645747.1 hypothetical protein HanOQP8_Chr16g0627361 [Helianthus annuus]
MTELLPGIKLSFSWRLLVVSKKSRFSLSIMFSSLCISFSFLRPIVFSIVHSFCK